MRYVKLQNTMRHADRSTRYSVLSTQYAPLHPSLRAPFRRAVTLIEMLIVLFIVSLLAVMALRALPGEDQKPREAARMLNGYISSAKIQAATTGRPAGIILRPWSLANAPATTYANYSTLIEQCEVPPTYAGDTVDAVVQAQDWTTKISGGNLTNYDSQGRSVVKIRIRPNDFAPSLLRYGDRVQINGQGPVYTILQDGNTLNSTDVPSVPLLDFPVDAGGFIDFSAGTDTNPADGWIDNFYLTLFLDPLSSVQLPWPKSYSGAGWSGPISFTIIRQPVKSAVTPLQLPAGAGIDLAFSGTDDLAFSNVSNSPFYGDFRFYNNANPPLTPPIVITFSPNGSVDSLYVGPAVYHPTQTIYLLLGKLTINTGDPASSEPDNNWFDLKNIIVSINPQTGAISTNPVYPPFYNSSNPGPPFANDPPSSGNVFDPLNPPVLDTTKALNDPANIPYLQAIFYSRTYARSAQTMGGKR